MKHFTIFYLLILCTCAQRQPPMVTIPKQGAVLGKEISMIRTQRITAYLGIPYAQPPLGQLRFTPPVTDPLPSWSDVFNATKFAPACLQHQNNSFDQQELPFLHLISDLNYNTSEDCLYLNVFVPSGGYTPPEGFAVIVWIHPGNFTSGDPAMWNPYTLVNRHRVIVVTFAYRLNILGFFTTNDGEATGNYGIMDQQAALQWVKNNVKNFQGNPNNICLMGYGSGAVSVGIHLINTQSSPLFSKAIMMSGYFLNPSAVKFPKEDEGFLEKFGSTFGCYLKPTSALMECLRTQDGDALVELSTHIDWKPLIDQTLTNGTPFLPEPPKNFFDKGEYYKIPILTGYTDMEDVLAIDEIQIQSLSDESISKVVSDMIRKDYEINNDTDSCSYNEEYITDSVMFFYEPTTKLEEPDDIRKLIVDFSTDRNYGSSTYLHAKYVSKDQQPTYLYRCDMKPSTPGATAEIPEWVSVPHLFDLIYVWGIPFWARLPDQEWDIRDKRTSDIIMSFWTNFAKTSNPTESSVYPITWEPFTTERPSILIIDRNFSMANQFNYKSLEFWNEYYPKVVSIATQCCNATDWASATHQFNNFNLSTLLITSVIIFNLI